MQPYQQGPAGLDRIRYLDQFFVQQRFAPVANLYLISTVGLDGRSAGELLASVRQKRMKIREQINFFADEAQTVPLLQLRARKVFEFRGVTDVVLPDGQVIGTLRKAFGASLLRSSWSVLDAAGVEVATARESSMFIAILRRIWSSIASRWPCRRPARSGSWEVWPGSLGGAPGGSCRRTGRPWRSAW